MPCIPNGHGHQYAGGGNHDRVAVDLRNRIDELLVGAGKLEPPEVSAFGSPRLPELTFS